MGSALCGPRMVEARREWFGIRWCFGCRAKKVMWKVVMVEAEPGYYGPHVSLKCETCGQDRTRMDGEPVRFEEADQ